LVLSIFSMLIMVVDPADGDSSHQALIALIKLLPRWRQLSDGAVSRNRF
jgi:hypothetical protein